MAVLGMHKSRGNSVTSGEEKGSVSCLPWAVKNGVTSTSSKLYGTWSRIVFFFLPSYIDVLLTFIRLTFFYKRGKLAPSGSLITGPAIHNLEFHGEGIYHSKDV